MCLIAGATADRAVVAQSSIMNGLTSCSLELSADSSDAVLHSVLIAGDKIALSDSEIVEAVAPHLYQGRVRAASLSLLRASRQRDGCAKLVAACAQVRSTGDAHGQ